MKAILFTFLSIMFSITLFAKEELVDGIAMFVNDEPVTVYEIYKTAKLGNVSFSDAMEQMVGDRLFQAEVKRYKIDVTELDINDEIKKVATMNNMSIGQMREQVARSNMSWEQYTKEMKIRLIRSRLYSKILADKIEIVDQSDMLAYFEANKNIFGIPKTVNTIKYFSTDETLLKKFLSNPIAKIDGIEKEQEAIELSRINTNLQKVFIETPESSFTPIVTLDEYFISFYIESKDDVTYPKFEQVKNQIYRILMKSQEDEIIKEYFQKLRANAKVKVIRTP